MYAASRCKKAVNSRCHGWGTICWIEVWLRRPRGCRRRSRGRGGCRWWYRWSPRWVEWMRRWRIRRSMSCSLHGRGWHSRLLWLLELPLWRRCRRGMISWRSSWRYARGCWRNLCSWRRIHLRLLSRRIARESRWGKLCRWCSRGRSMLEGMMRCLARALTRPRPRRCRCRLRNRMRGQCSFMALGRLELTRRLEGSRESFHPCVMAHRSLA